MMYPPSVVCLTLVAPSSFEPPNNLFHCSFPEESVFIIQTSFIPAPEDSVQPAMMYPPSTVCCTDSPSSSLDPPKVLFQSSFPTELVFISQTL